MLFPFLQCQFLASCQNLNVVVLQFLMKCWLLIVQIGWRSDVKCSDGLLHELAIPQQRRRFPIGRNCSYNRWCVADCATRLVTFDKSRSPPTRRWWRGGSDQWLPYADQLQRLWKLRDLVAGLRANRLPPASIANFAPQFAARANDVRRGDLRLLVRDVRVG